MDGNCTLNPHSKNNKFIFVNNLDFLEDGPIHEGTTKKDLLRNFNNSCLSPNPAHRGEEKRLEEKSSMSAIESMKKNVQKFLISNEAFRGQKLMKDSGFKPEKIQFKIQPYPNFSVPRQRGDLTSSDKTLKRSKFGLSKMRGKLRVNTRLQLKDDPGFIDLNNNRERHNYSVACTPTMDLMKEKKIHGENDVKNRTIESREQSVNSATFKLPQLSTRNRRRAKYSTSSARKKLPKCFLMDEEGRNSSRRSIKMEYLMVRISFSAQKNYFSKF